jgi:hypothetical protein
MPIRAAKIANRDFALPAMRDLPRSGIEDRVTGIKMAGIKDQASSRENLHPDT